MDAHIIQENLQFDEVKVPPEKLAYFHADFTGEVNAIEGTNATSGILQNVHNFKGGV